MAENTESIIIDVQIDTAKMQKELSLAISKVASLKEQQKELTKAIQEGKDVDGQMAANLAVVTAELEKTNREVKSKTALMQAANIQDVSANETLDEQRQKLNTLQKAYANMTDEQRNATVQGQTLTERIKKLSDSVKAQEAAIGDNRRNVGNYTESILEASKQMGGFGNASARVITGVKGMTTGLKAMAATPVIAILNVLITIIAKLSERFKSNAAAMEGLTKVFGLFNGVGVLVDKLIDKLAEGIGWLADKLSGLADKLGLVNDEMKESQRIAQAELDMNKKQRASAKANADDAQKIAELRAKANEKDKVGTAERLRLLQQASDMEEQIAKRNAELAKEQYELQVAKNAQTNSSQEDLNKENELYIQMVNAQTSYLAKQRELAGQMAELRNQQIAEAKAAAAVRLEIERKLEDTLIAMDTDAVTRQVNQIRVAGEREVENLKIKLENLKKTDKKGREALGKLIVEIEKKTQREIDEVVIQAEAQRANALRQNRMTEYELMTTDTLQLAKFREQQAVLEFNRILNLTEEQQRVLYGTREAYDAAVLEADRNLSQAREQIQLEEYNRRKLNEQNEYARRLQNIQEGDEVALAAAELAQAQAEFDALAQMDAAIKEQLYSSEEEYTAAMIEAENKVTAAKKKGLEATRQMAAANAQSIASVMGAISGLLNEFGEENEAAAKASKVLALGKIAVDTGVAIAGGVAQAQSVPFPANIAAIATTIATVVANMASAISTVKSAKFADGGIVPGSSYSGDRVTAGLNSREMVLNMDQQKELFKIANGGLTSGIDYELLGETMAAAVSSQPAPTVVWKEMKEFDQKVTTYKEIASL